MAAKYQRTLMVSACALDGHGKTTFLFSGPKPMSVFHIDPNTEEIAEKEGLLDDDDVTLHHVPYPSTVFHSKDKIQDEAERSWEDKLIDPLKEAIEDDRIRTIGLDTGTELFELKMMADHGKTIQILPEMRTKTNYVFKGLLAALKRSGKNVIILHRLKDVWETTERNTREGKEESREKVKGLYEREGFNRIGYMVNVEIMLAFDPSREGNLSSKYGMKVVRSTQRPSLVEDNKMMIDDAMMWGKDKETKQRRASFPYLATLVYPTTKIEDWE